MIDTALNSDWDLAFIDGDLSEVSGGQLTRQNSKFRLQIIAGELFEDTRAGVPWLSDMVDPRVSMDAKKAILRANIVKSFGCISVDSLSVVVEDDIARVDFAGTCANGQFEESLVIYSEGTQANSGPSFGTDARIINLPVITETYSTSFAMYGSKPVLCIVDALSTGGACEIITLGNLVVYTSDGQLLASGNGAVTLDPASSYDNLYVYIYQPFPQPQQTITLSFVIAGLLSQGIIDAMDNEPVSARKYLIERTYNSLVAAGIWDKADVLAFRAAADQQAGLLDWKRLVDHTWTAPVNGEFVPDAGFDIVSAGGGSGIDTGYSPATGTNYTQNDAAIAVLVQNHEGDFGYLFGAAGDSALAYLSFRNDLVPMQVNGAINSDGSAWVDAESDTANGFWLLQRTAADSVALYHNGPLVSSSSDASSALPNYNLFDSEYSASSLTARKVFIYAGGSLNETQRTELQTIVNDYLAGL